MVNDLLLFSDTLIKSRVYYFLDNINSIVFYHFKIIELRRRASGYIDNN